MDDAHTLSAKVVRMTDVAAELLINHQPLVWPRSALPAGIREGDTVNVRVLDTQTAALERHEQARMILAEILGGRS